MGQPGIPGSSVQGDDWLVRRVQQLERDLQRLAAANPFATMGISPKDGGIDVVGFLHSLRTDKTLSLSMDSTGAFVVYAADGTTQVARFGELVNTNPGNYGVEIFYNGAWAQVGAGNADWSNITNKPATYPPSAHTHAGSEVTSRVAAATDAIGTASGWANNVSGTQFYALWVGNDGSFSMGRNTSSIRYKQNVVDHDVDPARVLALQPRLYDRRDYIDVETGETKPGAKGEYGLIAEEVQDHVPEIVTWFEGQIDGVRYDLLSVALLDVVKKQQQDIEALKTAVRNLGGTV